MRITDKRIIKALKSGRAVYRKIRPHNLYTLYNAFIRRNEEIMPLCIIQVQADDWFIYGESNE